MYHHTITHKEIYSCAYGLKYDIWSFKMSVYTVNTAKYLLRESKTKLTHDLIIFLFNNLERCYLKFYLCNNVTFSKQHSCDEKCWGQNNTISYKRDVTQSVYYAAVRLCVRNYVYGDKHFARQAGLLRL